MKIYLDFDRTLFNTDMFFQDLEKLIAKYLPISLFKEYQSKSGFNIKEILNNIEKVHSFNHDLYSEIDHLINHCYTYVYDDSESFLKKIKDLGFKVILLTRGNREYQLQKVHGSHLEKYFDDIIITLNYKGDLDLDYQNSIFIDDNPIEIDSIIKKHPKRIIRIKRDNSLYNNIHCSESIEVITSFNDIKFQ